MRLPSIILFLIGLVPVLLSASAVADDTVAGPPGVVVQRVAFTEDQFPGTATRDAEVAIDYWFKIISDHRKTAQIAKTTVYPTFLQLRRALERRELDVISILSLDYLRVRDSIKLEPFTVATRGDDPYTQFVLYVHKDSGITNLADLAGEKIIVDATEGSELGRFWFETLLLRQGLDPLDFVFSEEVDKASRAVLPVYFRQTAACIAASYSFDTMRELNPRVGTDLVALEVSPPLISGVVCFTTEIRESDKYDIVDTILALHEDPQGQQVLHLFRRDKTIAYAPAQLETLVELVEERERLENRMIGRTAGIP